MNNQTNIIGFGDFLEALNRHQEIEFSLFKKRYFATPITDPPEVSKYAVLDVETNTWIFSGTLDELLHYRFDSAQTFIDHFTAFCIDYIL